MKAKTKSPKQTKTSVSLKWVKVSKAKKYVIYGNRCGKNIKPKRLVAVKAGSTARIIRKISGSKIRKNTYYKFIIVALDKNNNVISTSKLINAATKGGRYTNHKSVKVKKSILAKARKLKKGNKLRLNAKAVKISKKLIARKHIGIRYEASNKKIAAVSGKGVIIARKKGTCYVYAYAQNGVCRKIKVVVR